MTINNANVEQINVALLDLDKRIKALNIDNEAIKSLQNSVKTIKSSLNETKAGLQSGATYNINISGNATTATYAATATTAEIVNSAASADEANHAVSADTATNANHAETATTADAATNATNANLSKTLDTVNGDKLQIGSGTAQNITNAKHAATADNGVPMYSTSDAGKNLAVNGDGTGTEWVKPRTVKFVDYKTESLTFNSITDQKGIELSNFGPDVTEDNVLSFMVIYWSGVIITASGDWAKSQGTNSGGLKCALHALQAGTGWCVIRCVYLA